MIIINKIYLTYISNNNSRLFNRKTLPPFFFKRIEACTDEKIGCVGKKAGASNISGWGEIFKRVHLKKSRYGRKYSRGGQIVYCTLYMYLSVRRIKRMASVYRVRARCNSNIISKGKIPSSL